MLCVNCNLLIGNGELLNQHLSARKFVTVDYAAVILEMRGKAQRIAAYRCSVAL